MLPDVRILYDIVDGFHGAANQLPINANELVRMTEQCICELTFRIVYAYATPNSADELRALGRYSSVT